jgi:flavin reductase (DIM6/NTAB) family NADH-FMN oxidoreductase RutF
VSDAQFHGLVAALDGAMVVVTTVADGVRAGCLVGFHTQCAMDPPLYAVWLSKANRTYRIGALADTFALHFLAPEDRALAELFGTVRGDEVDKFERCAWTPGPDGIPLLDDCPRRFVGRRTALLDPGGDHVCVILDPVEATSGDGAFLTFQQVKDLDAGHPPEDRQQPR